MSSFQDELDDLNTAEDFLRFFGIAFDERVVHVNRLHILQRFHDYLAEEPNLDRLDEDLLRVRHKVLITQAYEDFVKSDAIAEKVFKVHKDQAERHDASFVSLESLTLAGVR
ncbi:nitrogen fixation protein NifW [Skermanella stibiiresistens SB22]|jgi:nitrogenase-stabilizing/protective protein|uniref:Nitrogenase-stabilizing/protective protein NifW n=1 Tax=Skermanella stibiiresistens SB22 TaxID=1385369 RepID=W9H732_9PROT|nr:nitrogenase-stabilizing/protective protein NifW [Skermanella stibiiresistens]EWY39583.1 nitrogen fixation protein NifW [Skermanella stibiiresistens SB22]